VENQAGAGGALAARNVARATPDGYTLFFSALPQIAILPAAGVTGYDPVKDFAPVCNVGTNPFVLMTPPSFKARTLAELIDEARAHPGGVSFASAGLGSLAHLSAALLWHRAKVELLHVPYQGDAPAMTALLGGQVNCYFGNISVAIPQSKAGVVRAIAISDSKRNPQLPDVPTVAESGYDGFRTITWNGLLAPSATPKAVVERLARECQAIVREPDFSRALSNYGVDPLGDGPEAFAKTIASDMKLFAEAVAMTGVKMQQ
jgi:tripartite-type tricarboxylate transporter receptor subunit TctC